MLLEEVKSRAACAPMKLAIMAAPERMYLAEDIVRVSDLRECVQSNVGTGKTKAS